MAEFDREDMVATFRQLALLGGQEIMKVYGSEAFFVEEKSDSSPVTAADLAADAVISAGLREAYPGLPLVTEEQADSHSQTVDTFLIVDPLDGTKEFVKRRGDFTVNIALVERGEPTLGVVYAPARERMFYTHGGGAVEEVGDLTPERKGELRPISVSEPDNTSLRIVASKSHRSAELETYIGRYSVSDSIAAGSSLKFCLVATGEADFYPRLGPTMEWDTAAGDAVLRAAGGEVRRHDDLTLLHYGKPDFRNPYFLAMAPGVDLITG